MSLIFLFPFLPRQKPQKTETKTSLVPSAPLLIPDLYSHCCPKVWWRIALRIEITGIELPPPPVLETGKMDILFLRFCTGTRQKRGNEYPQTQIQGSGRPGEARVHVSEGKTQTNNKIELLSTQRDAQTPPKKGIRKFFFHLRQDVSLFFSQTSLFGESFDFIFVCFLSFGVGLGFCW